MPRPLTAADAPPEVATANTRPFETLMAVEGRWTGDDRIIMVNALTWDGLLPFALTAGHGADTNEVAGWAAEIERIPGMTPDERFIVGRGQLNLGTEAVPNQAGIDAVAQLEAGQPLGVSIDIDAIANGGIDPEEDPGQVDPMWASVVESARIRSLALVVIPAFAEALITLGTLETGTPVPAIEGPTPLPADEVPEIEMPEDVIIIASGQTIHLTDLPPAEWFDEPLDVEIAGALTVTEDGRVYGLLAPENVPHAGLPGRVTVPMGRTDYAPFTRGETPVAGGGRVATGNVTFECGHGNSQTTAAGVVMEHYDNTCSIAATIAVGERTAEPRGVWVAGALMPGVTQEQVRRMMASQLSGHWTPDGRGGYELLAALLVPVPGFGMPRSRPSVTVRDGVLVASAVPVRFEGGCGCGDGWEAEMDELRRRLDAVENIAGPLRSNAADAIAASVRG